MGRRRGRTFRARVVAARPDNAMEITKSDSFSLSETMTGRPSSVAGPSLVAANDSWRVGSTIAPTAGAPSMTSAIETQKTGMPLA